MFPHIYVSICVWWFFLTKHFCKYDFILRQWNWISSRSWYFNQIMCSQSNRSIHLVEIFSCGWFVCLLHQITFRNRCALSINRSDNMLLLYILTVIITLLCWHFHWNIFYIYCAVFDIVSSFRRSVCFILLLCHDYNGVSVFCIRLTYVTFIENCDCIMHTHTHKLTETGRTSSSKTQNKILSRNFTNNCKQ